MPTKVLSIVRSTDPGAPVAANPVLDLNAYALADDVELTLVLKAAGVEIGVTGAHISPATVGGFDVPAAAADADLRALMASGVRVLAVEEDVTARGLSAGDLLDGIATIPESDLTSLVLDTDVTLTWSVT